MWRSQHLAFAALLACAGAGCDEDNHFVGVGDDGFPAAFPGTIEGSVHATGAPVGAAWVIALELRDSVITNGQGRYRFSEVPASVYTVSLRVPLQYRLISSDSTTQTVTVTPGGLGVANWRLVHAGPIP